MSELLEHENSAQLENGTTKAGHGDDEYILSLPYTWAKAWSEKDDSTWLSLYAPNAEYIDHAFCLRRSGYEILKRHFEIWVTANPDYEMEISHVERTSYGVTFRTIGRGTFKNDLPNIKASGNRFENHGFVDIVIVGTGRDARIEEVDEYYSKNYDEAKGVDSYHTLSDLASTKK